MGTDKHREQRETNENRETEISANSHGHFYVGIHPNSIYGEGSRVWLRGRKGEKTKFSMALTSGTRGKY